MYMQIRMYVCIMYVADKLAAWAHRRLYIVRKMVRSSQVTMLAIPIRVRHTYGNGQTDPGKKVNSIKRSRSLLPRTSLQELIRNLVEARPTGASIPLL